MDCSSCNQNLEAYLEGRLPEDMRTEFLAHLKECDECNAYYASMVLTGKMIAAELGAAPNPFIHTRIMAKIESMYENPAAKERSVLGRILQPALITLSLAAAIFTGIAAGSLFTSAVSAGNIPEEFVYLDDASLESISLLTNE